MRRLVPALALAAAVSLFAAVPQASAQNGGMGMPGYGYGTGMGMSGMGMNGMGMSGMGTSGLSAGTSTSESGSSLTCAIGQVVPFSIPTPGIDQNGRPYFFTTEGWYGPYDGFGYPVTVNTIGMYGGQPMVRSSHGYIPSPCPAGATSGSLGSLAGVPASTSLSGLGMLGGGFPVTNGLSGLMPTSSGLLPGMGGFGGSFGTRCPNGFNC